MSARRVKARAKRQSGRELVVIPNDRVVADANVFADFVVGRIIKSPFGDAEAAERVFASCAVFVASNYLLGEIIPAANRRTRLAPGLAKGILDSLESIGKLNRYSHSAVEAKQLSRAVRREVPTEDHHVVQLAAAASAKFVLTRDREFQRSGRASCVREVATIISVEEALSIERPEKPCP